MRKALFGYHKKDVDEELANLRLQNAQFLKMHERLENELRNIKRKMAIQDYMTDFYLSPAEYENYLELKKLYADRTIANAK